MLNRRQFGQTLAATSFFASLNVASRGVAAGVANQPRKKIAFLGTEVYLHSHPQHFLDRFAAGFATGGKWHAPQVDIASVYIEQVHDKDLSRERIQRYGLKQFPTVAEALTLGGSSLAVDGVVIVGEHGDYPKNEKGQTIYPRYAWFKEAVKLFEASGRSVPVFNDKHLSTDWNECREMVADSKRLGFPFYAGSSLPVTWRLPAYELPIDTPLTESVCVGFGGIDSYDFHAIETAQCMSERRAGGEVGIRSVKAVKGEKLWALLESKQREQTRELFVSALCRSHNLPVDNGFPSAPVTYEWARQTLPDTLGYFIEHLDGFHTTIFLTAIRDFNYAGLRADNGEIVGCQMYLPMPGHGSTTADFFNPLSQHVENMFLRGTTPYPIERTLLTSGMVIGGVESLFADGAPFVTDEMAVQYKAPETSMFWRV